MEQQTGSKYEKEYIKAVYCHPAYLTYMQSTSREMLGWREHKLESRLLGEILITSDMQTIPALWQKVKRPGIISPIQFSSVAQSCWTLWDPMDWGPWGSSLHGILQARRLEWVAIPFSRESSCPRDLTWVSCIAGRFLTAEPPGKPKSVPTTQ